MSNQTPSDDGVTQEDRDAELLEELRNVGSSLAFRNSIRRVMKFVVILTAASVIASVISIVALIGIRKIQVRECERDNEFRKAYVDQWTPILADSPRPEKPPADASKEVKEAYERSIRTRTLFENSLDTDFAQRPC